jgi:hypothetical protein
MDKKVKNAIILVLVVFVIVAIQQGILYSIDKSIGSGNAQVIVTGADGEEWTMGLVPHLQTMPIADANAAGLKVWAAPGDYSGDAVIGITGAIAAVMWIVWMGVFLGFPSNIKLKKEKIIGLIGISFVILILNLIILRAVADATTSLSVLHNATGHLSLALNNTGILFGILLVRLRVGGRDPNQPFMPGMGGPNPCGVADQKFYKKFNGVLMMLILTAVIEIICEFGGIGIPEVAVDASVWLIWGIIFIAHFGTYPSDWKLGKRPKGIALMVVLTVLTIVGFYMMQVATSESLGSGVGETRLFNAYGSYNAGLSLMLSCWFVFWTIALGSAGFCDPGECKPKPTEEKK